MKKNKQKLTAKTEAKPMWSEICQDNISSVKIWQVKRVELQHTEKIKLHGVLVEVEYDNKSSSNVLYLEWGRIKTHNDVKLEFIWMPKLAGKISNLKFPGKKIPCCIYPKERKRGWAFFMLDTDYQKEYIGKDKIIGKYIYIYSNVKKVYNKIPVSTDPRYCLNN